jgi:hypothetical protein
MNLKVLFFFVINFQYHYGRNKQRMVYCILFCNFPIVIPWTKIEKQQ